MIRLRGTVTYLDGREETFERGSAILVAWEAYARRHGIEGGMQANPLTASTVIAHAALGIAEGYDVWLATVDGVDMESEGVPPTLAVATGAA
jgi:hypothetical protein